VTGGPTRSRWRERGPLIGLAALTALCAFLYAGVFRGEPAGDDNTFHLAEIAHLARALGAGDLDWWNPSANLGFASGYYYQVLPQLVPAALAALTGGDPLFWFQLAIAAALVLAPAAAYRGARLTGATGWQALGAATAVAVCLSSSKWGHGPDGTFMVGLYTQTWALAAFPLALGGGVRWLETGRGLGGAVASGVFVGLCHPFAGVALGVGLAGGELVRTALDRDGAARRLARLALLGALLVAGSACAWLPVLIDYDGFGGFPHRVAGEAGPGLVALGEELARGRVLDAGRPPVLTWLVPVALAAAAPWRARLGGAALAFGALLAIGPSLVTPDDLFPAVRFFGAFQIVLATIAGAGAVALVERLWPHAAARRRPPIRAALLTAVLAIGLLAVIPGARTIRARVRVATDFPDIHRDQLDTFYPAIRAAAPGRQQVRGGAEAHWLNLLPFIRADRPALFQMGGAGLQSSPNYVFLYELRLSEHAARAAWLFDAPLVLSRRFVASQFTGATELAATDDLVLLQLPAPGLVSPVQVMGELPPGRAPARAAALRWLASSLPDEGRVLAYHGHGVAGPPPAGRVLASERRPPGDGPDLVASVEAAAATTFVVRESWHPRWRATLDGAPAPVRRVTPDVMAIDVPAGRHALAWEFDRPWWVLALWLAWPAAALAGRFLRY
jgi:hypothetical protein